MGEGSRGLGKNQRGLRVGCCAMVGDYYDDSSVKENLNLLLCLAQVETNIDSNGQRGKGIFEGRLQRTRMLGASTATSCQRTAVQEVFKEAKGSKEVHTQK